MNGSREPHQDVGEEHKGRRWQDAVIVRVCPIRHIPGSSLREVNNRIESEHDDERADQPSLSLYRRRPFLVPHSPT